jgi:hypothetical protein
LDSGERAPARRWTDDVRAFATTTNPVTATTQVKITITACCGAGGQVSRTLTVTPDAPPPPDDIRIQRARSNTSATRGIDIRVQGSRDTAILTVFHPSGFMLGTLEPVGGGRYEGFVPIGQGSPIPDELVVQSNLGGSDTSRVR